MVRNLDTGGSASPGAPCEDVRCGCGSLLARLVDGAVELKCRRCKRVWSLALEAGRPGPGGWRLAGGGAA